jgi:bifunctional UDP-N-acetylglucosamine pyrophosphorylase/glucosamine-1-phosphate N-acetyltransferase
MSQPAGPDLALILAAGKGTRMKSRLPKAAHRLLGKPLAGYVVDLARRSGAARVAAVVGHGAAAVREALGPDVEYVEQREQRGTGDAVLAARELLTAAQGPVLVLQADNVLLTDDCLQELLARHGEKGAAATLLSAIVPRDAGAYGRVLRSDWDGSVKGIVEARSATPEQLIIPEINVGAYVFEARALLDALDGVKPNAVSGELYLTDVIGLLGDSGARVEAVRAEDWRAALSVNDRVELAEAGTILRERINRRHMLNGVTLEDPAATYIEPDVEIGRDTVIRPQTWLSGRTVIGEECELGPLLRVTDCVLGDRVTAQNAVLAESRVGEGCRIGPFAQLRPGCRLGRKVKIGNFVELKKAEVEDGVSIGHLAYVGDAVVGEKTNVGAGTITCNYDGKHKHVTRIGKGVFVGSHTTLVAPVELEDGAFTAAGSVVTQDVPADALAVARSRQENKPGWARKYRERQGHSAD